MEANIWYIYQHLKPCGEVFYIGIGKAKNFSRAYEKGGRNRYWKNKIKKYPNYEVQVLTKGLTKDEASEIETILISYYGRIDKKEGTLVNMTDGGDGISGYKVTEELRIKRSIMSTGENNPMFGKLGELHHSYGSKRSEESKQRMSKSHKGISSVKGEEHPNSKLVLDTQTGIFYYCTTEAAEALGMNKKTLQKWLSGSKKNKSSLKYI